MKAPDVITIDFETKRIQARPEYPPKPVGVSIDVGGKAEYLAWGHPSGNNCTEAEAKARLKAVWKAPLPKLFHHAKFDMDVAETHMGMKPLKWEEFHDTQFLLFLDDPHALSHSLKPSAERVLGIKPDERDAVRDWLIKHQPEEAGEKITLKNWGAFISLAPGKLVGKYANGDTSRTKKLFKHLYPRIIKAGMGPAYDRERKILPIFLENERTGLRVDLAALKRDITMYEGARLKAEKWLCKRLKVPADFNWDSDASVAEALDKNGVVTEWEVTKTGKKSTSKKTMTAEKFNDRRVYLVLGYRNRLSTCLNSYMYTWAEQAERNAGFIHTNWNQVRQPKGDDEQKGTRTGRPSTDNPNFLAISKSFEDRGDDWTHPSFLKLEPLPLVRKYLLPDPGCLWLHRDYNQQELRLLAHFEDGKLMKAYKEDPRLDVHTFIQEVVAQITGIRFDRVSIKTTVFGRIYGQGLGGLALKLRRPVEEIKQIRDAQNKALPGLPDIDKNIKDLAKAGNPIVTWGGRVYYVEPPKFVEKFNREMTFEYKLLNYLIQGSAADATKEAIIRFYYHKRRSKGWRFLVTVYDEINICAPKKEQKAAMQLLRECMESIEVDVPFLTDGKVGESWGNLAKEKTR